MYFTVAVLHMVKNYRKFCLKELTGRQSQQRFRKYTTEPIKFLTQVGIPSCFIFHIIQKTLDTFLLTLIFTR